MFQSLAVNIIFLYLWSKLITKHCQSFTLSDLAVMTDESAIVLLFHHHWLKVTPQKALALKDGPYLLAPIHLRSLGPKINLCRNYKSGNYTIVGI